MNPQPDMEAPWLAPQMEQLRRARLAGRFPSALLIHDQRGAGGVWLAHQAARLALCRAALPPCGSCRDCRLLLAAQHPDFITVAPLEDSKQIRIEQIRDLAEQLTLTAHGGGATVAVIAPADAMNANAANALLKTLEEPRSGVSLILVASIPSRLPATILSRCQSLRVCAPNRDVALRWLERYYGPGPWPAVLDVLGCAPFEAAQVNPVDVARLATETFTTLRDLVVGSLGVAGLAERWTRAENFGLRLACIETWLTACVDHAAGAADESLELSTGAHLPAASWDMNIAALLRLLDGAFELRRMRLSSINLSIALEQLLWQLPRAVRAAASI